VTWGSSQGSLCFRFDLVGVEGIVVPEGPLDGVEHVCVASISDDASHITFAPKSTTTMSSRTSAAGILKGLPTRYISPFNHVFLFL
jgi:hypothetical protein